jgi:hypothetical protein
VQKVRQATVDVIDVERCDLHRKVATVLLDGARQRLANGVC